MSTTITELKYTLMSMQLSFAPILSFLGFAYFSSIKFVTNFFNIYGCEMYQKNEKYTLY